MIDETTTTDSTDVEAFLATARARYAEAEEATRDIRLAARTDLRMVAGEQWDESTLRERQSAGRPALVINKLIGPIQQVVNETRQNKPSIKINPVDSGADKDTAKVFQGIIRHIEYASNADEAYDNAVEYSASCSFGYYRILTEYCDPKSFDQDIKIERIADPMTVYLDPHAKQSDASDGRWAFIRETMSREEFQKLYPKSETVSRGFFDGGENPVPEWVTSDTVTLAEYWYIDEKKHKLVTLAIEATGETKAFLKDEVPDPLPPGVTYAKGKDGEPIERETTIKQVKFCKITGADVLEETDWLGSWIPIIPVLGKELYIDGKRRLFSLIRQSHDSQRLFNYYRSAEAETVALAPKAPWIGFVGQFKSKLAQWKTANTVNYPFLEVDPIAVDGKPAPFPQRNVYEPPTQALSMGARESADDIKSTTSIYDAALGQKSNETSGLAIQRRQKESDVANFHFQDNLSRAQRHTGRILLELIPKIYDTEREVRVIGEDDRQRVVTVNKQYQDEDGKPQHYRLDAGRYDVTVTTGPSYTTQRQEAFDMMTQLATAYPPLMQIAGDIVFRNSDIPGADDLAERFKRTLAPGLADDKGQPQIPPQVQQQMAQMQQELKAAHDFAQSLHEQIQSKLPEIQAKIQIAKEAEETKRVIAFATLDQRDGLSLLQGDLAAVKHRMDMMQEAHTQAADQSHELAMQQNDQQHQAGMATQAQDAQAESQDNAQQHAAAQQTDAQDAAAEQAAQLPKAA